MNPLIATPKRLRRVSFLVGLYETKYDSNLIFWTGLWTVVSDSSSFVEQKIRAVRGGGETKKITAWRISDGALGGWVSEQITQSEPRSGRRLLVAHAYPMNGYVIIIFFFFYYSSDIIVTNVVATTIPNDRRDIAPPRTTPSARWHAFGPGSYPFTAPRHVTQHAIDIDRGPALFPP